MDSADFTMFGLSGSEILCYGGLAVMAASVAAALLCAVIFSITGKKLKEKLMQEYGEQQR